MRIGKNIILLDKSRLASRQQKRWLVSAVKTMARWGSFKDLSIITIAIVDAPSIGETVSSMALGYVDDKRIIKGDYNINVLAHKLSSRKEASLCLRHELQHNLDGMRCMYIKKYIDSLLKYLKSSYKTFDYVLAACERIRMTLFHFMYLVRCEGLAEYVSCPRVLGEATTKLEEDARAILKIKFDIGGIIRSIRSCKKDASKIYPQLLEIKKLSKSTEQLERLRKQKISSFKDILEDLEFWLGRMAECINELEEYRYSLGVHMTHVILWANRQLRVKDLMKINEVEFLKLYEKSCRKLHIPVIFTYKQYKIILSLLANIEIEFKRCKEICSGIAYKVPAEFYTRQ